MASNLFRTVKRICDREGWTYERRAGAVLECYDIRTSDSAEAAKMRRTFGRCHVTAIPWSVPGEYGFHIVNGPDWERRQKINAARSALCDVFFLRLRENGGDQAAAKEAERLEAERMGIYGRLAFDEIYA